MSKDCCCLWVFGLILLMLIPVQTPIEEPEEDPEVTDPQYEQFAVVSGTNDDLEDLNNFKNLAEYNGTYWFIKDNSDPYVASVVGLTGSTVTAGANRNYDPGAGYAFMSGNARAWGDDIYLLAVYWNSGDGNSKFIRFKSTDGGANFAAVASTTLTGGTETYAIDIIKISTTIYAVVSWNGGGETDVFLRNFDTWAGSGLQFFTDNLSSHVVGGYCDGTKYYFLVDNPNVDATYISKYSFDGTTTAYVSSIGITIASITTWDVYHQLYWKQGSQEIFFNEDILQTRLYGKDDWTNITDVGTTTNGVIWDKDSNGNYIINYIIWKDSIYKVDKGGGIGKIQIYTGNAYVGYDNWFSNGADAIWQASYTALPSSQALVVSEHLKGEKVSLKSTTQPFDNQLLIIGDENDTLRAQVFVKKYIEKKGKNYIYKCESPIDYDLKRKVSFTSSAEDAPDILKYVIDNYCRFLHYGSSTINTTPATTYSLPFTGTVKSVFKWAEQQEGYYISIRPDGEVYYDQMTASGDTLTFGTDAMGVPDYQNKPLKISYIYLEGGYKDGALLISEKGGSPDGGWYKDKFPMIDNQTDLDNMRDKIIARYNQTITEYNVMTHGVMYFYYGTTVTLTDANYSITADTYYITGSVWNLLAGKKMCGVKLKSALYIPIGKDRTTGNRKIDGAIENVRDDMDEQIDNVSQYVDNIEKNIHWTWRDTASYDFNETTLTDNQTTWTDIDLSAIVGSKTMMVNLYVYIKHTAAAQYLLFRQNGQTNTANRHSIYTQVANIPNAHSFLIKTDSAGKIEFYGSNKPTDWTDINIYVRGYKDA